MTQITTVTWEHILAYRYEGTWPHQIRPAGPGIDTEAGWNAYRYNPPGGYYTDWDLPFDETAPPKPTWAELVDASRRGALMLSTADVYSIRERAATVRREVADAFAVKVHSDEGLDHMTGLLQMVEHANMAGNDIPHIVLRDSHGTRMSIHTQDHIRDVLSEVAARENKIESAHNAVMARFQTWISLRDDESQTLDVREAADKVATGIYKNYADHLQKAIDDYDPDALPNDLSTVKAVYVERLEAAALGRDKEIRGHLTNQGVMLHPSCADQETAQQAVAAAYFHGSAAVRKADTADKAGKAFTRAKAAIQGVEVVNTPVFTVNSLPPTGEEYPLAEVLVSADHPEGVDIPGEVEIIGVRVSGGTLKDGSPAYRDGGAIGGDGQPTATGHTVALAVDPQHHATVVVRARNLCGVSRIVVQLRNPTQYITPKPEEE